MAHATLKVGAPRNESLAIGQAPLESWSLVCPQEPNLTLSKSTYYVLNLSHGSSTPKSWTYEPSWKNALKKMFFPL